MNTAIVAAAGQGTRMGGRLAKQFLELDGVPIIIHTLRRFEQSKEIDEIVVVVPGEDAAGFLTLADRYSLKKLSRVVQGGPTRAQSVWRGLQSLRPATAQIVAVHDGVRPFVTPDEIDLVVRTAAMTGAAVLAAPVTDTIKQVGDGQVIATVERTSLRRALTPQCFRYEVIRKAFEQAESLDAAVTDESYLVERLGLRVAVVEGSPRNIKITSPEDLAIGEYLLRKEKSVKE